MLNQLDFVPNFSRFNKKCINLDKCRTKTIQFQTKTAFLKATLHSKDMMFLKAALQICSAKKLQILAFLKSILAYSDISATTVWSSLIRHLQ